MDLRKVVKSSLSGVSQLINFYNSRSEDVGDHRLGVQVDKSITLMYKRLQKNLTSDELLPSLWDKCKVYVVNWIPVC